MKKCIYLFSVLAVFACSKEKMQDAYVSTESHEVNISEDNFELDYKGQTLKMEIKSNGKWKASSNVDWITVDNSEREGHGVLNKESAILSPIYRERYRFRRCTSTSWQAPISR